MCIKTIKIVVAVMICFVAMAANPATLTGKIYVWTDENGVKSFSNVPPPEEKLDDLEIREEERFKEEGRSKVYKPARSTRDRLPATSGHVRFDSELREQKARAREQRARERASVILSDIAHCKSHCRDVYRTCIQYTGTCIQICTVHYEMCLSSCQNQW
jgi:hypothetical protein